MIPAFRILLAEDDNDDCFLFEDALRELALRVSLIMVDNGEKLMHHLDENAADLPQVLFLDLNMPRKNGYECLIEIKQHTRLKTIPVIILSTSYDEDKAQQLYIAGASYYICKPADFNELKNVIHRALLLTQQSATPPNIDHFLINKSLS